MKTDKRMSREERDFLVGIDVSVDIVGDTNPDIGRRVMGEVIEVQDHVNEKGGVILLCEGEFNHTSPFDGEKQARADALRMAHKYKAIGKVNFMSEYEQVKLSCEKQANEIIAKYEEK